jgi:hypothetical protein
MEAVWGPISHEGISRTKDMASTASDREVTHQIYLTHLHGLPTTPSLLLTLTLQGSTLSVLSPLPSSWPDFPHSPVPLPRGASLSAGSQV